MINGEEPSLFPSVQNEFSEVPALVLRAAVTRRADCVARATRPCGLWGIEASPPLFSGGGAV
jgi:hypothetical protein